jgi:hypothetical protein
LPLYFVAYLVLSKISALSELPFLSK